MPASDAAARPTGRPGPPEMALVRPVGVGTHGASVELLIDRIRCDGYGMCAELLPELIELDDWGYPILRSATVPDRLAGHARRAVEACPVLALRVRSAAGG